jgi:hypothetical protein
MKATQKHWATLGGAEDHQVYASTNVRKTLDSILDEKQTTHSSARGPKGGANRGVPCKLYL